MEGNLARIHEAIAEIVPDRECIVFRDRRLSWAQVTERTRRLGNYLLSRGLKVERERSVLGGWESGQAHLALYLYNGNEYLEGMLGAYKARVAPFNVNFRYVEEELLHLLKDSRAAGILYHGCFAPTLAGILSELPDLEVLIQVDDGSGQELLPDAVDYEAALRASSPDRPPVEWSPDDLYILYTGGTTGLPKGVLWRQADIFAEALGGRRPGGREFASLEEILERAARPGRKTLPTAPFMHGAAHWAAFTNFHSGNTVVIQGEVRHLDAADILSTASRERVTAMLIVGDAFARPLLEELDREEYDLSDLRVLVTGGAPLNAALKEAFLERMPEVTIVDAIGSSESGAQGQTVSTRHSGASTGAFQPGPGSCVLDADLQRVLPQGSPEMGWFAKRGRVPLGYFRDREKTGRTFPSLDGLRYAVPGDRARHLDTGIIEVYGRDSQTITSGGEKIFAEEVENALKRHPAVWDAVVVGRPSDRWGQEVVAVVRLRHGVRATPDELRAECGQHVARYKLPKAFVFRDEIQRSPSGKPDYRWAREQVES